MSVRLLDPVAARELIDRINLDAEFAQVSRDMRLH